MALEQDSAVAAVAQAHVEAWSKRDFDSARKALADDVWVTPTAAEPNLPKTDLHRIEAYMTGLMEYAQAVVPGSTDVVKAVGDDRQALLWVNTRLKFGPDAPGMEAPAARMYLCDEDSKIKTEHVVFLVG